MGVCESGFRCFGGSISGWFLVCGLWDLVLVVFGRSWLLWVVLICGLSGVLDFLVVCALSGLFIHVFSEVRFLMTSLGRASVINV